MATHLWYKKKALIYQAAIPELLACLLPRSLGTRQGWGGWGWRGALGRDGGLSAGPSAGSRESGVSSTDQTRQQNLWYQT